MTRSSLSAFSTTPRELVIRTRGRRLARSLIVGAVAAIVLHLPELLSTETFHGLHVQGMVAVYLFAFGITHLIQRLALGGVDPNAITMSFIVTASSLAPSNLFWSLVLILIATGLLLLLHLGFALLRVRKSESVSKSGEDAE